MATSPTDWEMRGVITHISVHREGDMGRYGVSSSKKREKELNLRLNGLFTGTVYAPVPFPSVGLGKSDSFLSS